MASIDISEKAAIEEEVSSDGVEPQQHQVAIAAVLSHGHAAIGGQLGLKLDFLAL